MAQSTRRALLGTALAAGTVAAAAPTLAVEHGADAELIALAGAILAGHEESHRLSLIEDALGRGAGALQRRRQIRARQEVLTDAGWDMRARLAAMSPTTQAGLQAKARVAREFSDVEGLGSAYNDEALLWSIANDVLGLPSRFREEEHEDGGEDTDALLPLAASPRKSDAEFIALCDEYVALDVKWLEMSDKAGRLRPGDPAAARLNEELNALTPRQQELQEVLAEREPVTLAGVLALARAAQHQLSGDARQGAVDLPPEGELAWGAIESLITMMNALGVRAEVPDLELDEMRDLVRDTRVSVRRD